MLLPCNSEKPYPADCPVSYATQIKLAWSHEPSKRPPAQKLVEALEKVKTELFPAPKNVTPPPAKVSSSTVVQPAWYFDPSFKQSIQIDEEHSYVQAGESIQPRGNSRIKTLREWCLQGIKSLK